LHSELQIIIAHARSGRFERSREKDASGYPAYMSGIAEQIFNLRAQNFLALEDENLLYHAYWRINRVLDLWTPFVRAYVATMFPRVPHVAIYAFPGSGKTYIQSKIKITRSVEVDDTDFYLINDPQPHTIPKHEWIGRIQNLLFEVSSQTYSRRPILFSNVTEPQWFAGLEKNGYTIIHYNPPLKQWRMQLFTYRDGLPGVDREQVEKWRQDMVDHNSENWYDRVVRNSEEITEFTGTAFTGIGSVGKTVPLRAYLLKMFRRISPNCTVSLDFKDFNNQCTFQLVPTEALLFQNPLLPRHGEHDFGHVTSRMASFRELFDNDVPFFDLNGILALAKWGHVPSHTPYKLQVDDRLEARSSNKFVGWVVITKVLPHTNTDIWWAVQTMDARATANVIRSVTHVTDYFYKHIRREAIVEYAKYHGYDCMTFPGTPIIGAIKTGEDSAWIPLGVSGHLTNMLLASSLRPIDWRRYLNTIHWNFLNATKGASFGDKKLWQAGVFSEWSSKNYLNIPWHNLHEWIIAVWSYYKWMLYLQSENSDDTIGSDKGALGTSPTSWMPKFVLEQLLYMGELNPEFYDVRTVESKKADVSYWVKDASLIAKHKLFVETMRVDDVARFMR
jgi:hypothetical protein